MNRMQLKIVMLEVDTTLNIPQWIDSQNLKELANMICGTDYFLNEESPPWKMLRYIVPCFKTWSSWSFNFTAFLVNDLLTEKLYL